MLIFDSESDGLLREATKIHCIVVYDTKTYTFELYYDDTAVPVPSFGPVEYHGRVEDGVRRIGNCFSRHGPSICGHNICGHDIPLFNKLHSGWNPITLKGMMFASEEMLLSSRDPSFLVLDSFMLSCLLFPQQKVHGLDYWGGVMGIPKPTQEQWHTFDADMLNRCIQDVAINVALWGDRLKPKLEEHKKEGISWIKPLGLEQIVQEIHAWQEVHGVVYDTDKAIALWKRLDIEAEILRESVRSQVPPHVVDLFKGTPVNKPFNKNGSYSAMVLRHYEGDKDGLLRANIAGPFSRIGYEELNLDSDQQVKEYLLSLGWKPTEWNIDKKTRQRTSPKLTEDSYRSLPEGVGKTIADYNIITHRQSMIANRKGEESGGIWTVRDDGRVPAEAFTCGTPTSRYRHKKTVCNIPRPGTPYGEEIRSLFKVPDQFWQLGLDLKGIEIRVAAHFCFDYPAGPALAAEILSGDFHDMNAQIWQCSRNDAKTGLYALNHPAHVKLIELRGNLTAAKQQKAILI